MSVKSDEIQAGGFLLIALILLIVSIYTLGSERQLFGSRKSFEVIFQDVKGLREGAPVRLGGIAIGRVGKVGFSPDASSADIRVSILIDQRYLDRVRADSLASIETQGLLGDRYLKLETGESLELLEPGSIITAHEPADITEVLTSAGTIVDNTKEMSSTLRELLDDFKGEGLSELQASLSSLSNILNEVESGNGTIHHLVYADPDAPNIVSNIGEATSDFRILTKALRQGKGALGALIFDPEGEELIRDLRHTAGSLRTASDSLASLAVFFQQDDETDSSDKTSTTESMLEDLGATIRNIKIASQALAEARGTLGALLFDSRLYDQTLTLTEGAGKSLILREAIRASLPD